jgi:hypothetical protein
MQLVMKLGFATFCRAIEGLWYLVSNQADIMSSIAHPGTVMQGVDGRLVAL